MEIKDFVTRLVHNEALEEVAAQIAPLPENIVPSENFRREMRLRLLELDAGHKAASSAKAA